MPAPKQNADRDRTIAAKARLGMTLEALATEYHVTRQRIAQVVAAQNPQSPEESQRAEIAARLKAKYDELQAIVDRPPEMHSAIGRIVIGTDGRPVVNVSAVIAAIREQVKIAREYRAMFGLDLGTRPGPVLDEAHLIMKAEITVARQYMDRQAPAVSLAPLPDGYSGLSADEQMRAQLDRRRTALAIQRAVIPADDDVVDAELVD